MALPARAAPAPHRRPDGVLRARDPALQAAVGVRLPHPRGRLDRRAGARVHPRRRVRATSSSACRAGSTSTSFAPGLSFFFDSHIDFFEEIAKFRAARRIWARWLRERYGATSEKALWLRFHTQTAGVSLTAQQPVNNVVRTAIEALAAVLGGTNSLHTNALDETLALPTDESAEIALRTQQVIMEESGVANVADPLGGSWYVEALTDRIEAEAEAIFARILAMGGGDERHHPIGPMTSGILRGIEDGWFMAEIAESAFVYQQALEKGAKKIVGVNAHTGTVAPRTGDPARLARGRARAAPGPGAGAAGPRPGQGGRGAGATWSTAARTDANLIPAMLEAARAEATLGEICDALRAEWGVYREPARF